MLARRLRRRSNIKTTFGQCLDETDRGVMRVHCCELIIIYLLIYFIDLETNADRNIWEKHSLDESCRGGVRCIGRGG